MRIFDVTPGLLVVYCDDQLFGLSFWRHPFTLMLNLSKSVLMNKLIYILALGWVNCQQILIFAWAVRFIDNNVNVFSLHFDSSNNIINIIRAAVITMVHF